MSSPIQQSVTNVVKTTSSLQNVSLIFLFATDLLDVVWSFSTVGTKNGSSGVQHGVAAVSKL